MEVSQEEKLAELLGRFDTAVLITQSGVGNLHSRPMAIAQVEDGCVLWFITSESSGKVVEIREDQRVEVVCQNGWKCCVAISGGASLHRDRAKIQQVWKPAFKTWFPEGVDDPSIVLIRVEPLEAEYWDNEGINSIKYAYQSLKALATGTTPNTKEGDQHGTVRF